MTVRRFSIARGGSYLKGSGVVETADVGASDAVAADAAMDTLVTLSNTTLQGLEGAVVSALATLQADGASPTEAHVDTLQTAWDALLTAINNVQTQVTTTKTATALAETSTTMSASMQFVFDRGASLKKNEILHGIMEIYHHLKAHKAFPL